MAQTSASPNSVVPLDQRDIYVDVPACTVPETQCDACGEPLAVRDRELIAVERAYKLGWSWRSGCG